MASSFPHLTMQVKSAASETSAKHMAALLDDSLTEPPIKTKTITAFDDHSSEWKTTGTEISVDKHLPKKLHKVSADMRVLF